jgi:hypothetical protein
MEWDWNEVDGVTTLSAPEGAIQGPVQACLVFGVGRADETMPVAGITHVVEHLAFQPLGHLPYAHNGTVDTVCTRFMVTGGADDVVEFFRGITENLRDIPVDRLPQELQILQVEEQRAAGSQVGRDLSQRFGARATGLVGWPEHGLRRVGSDEVTAWAHTWFTARNAVLWTSAPLPEKLDLSALPKGSAPTHAPLAPLFTPPRTFVAERTNLVSVSAVMEGQPGVIPALQILQRRGYDRLRRRDAISYGIAVERVRLDAEHGLVYFGADGSEGKYTQVFECLVEVWDELIESGPTQSEWDDMCRGYVAQRDHPQHRLAGLDGDAERQVLGMTYISNDEWWAKIEALTPEQVRDDLAEIAPTLFGVTPVEVQDGAGGWSIYDPWSDAPVAGTSHQPIGGREEGTLIVGSEGVTWVAEDERMHTVRWDEAVCAFTWDNGRRTVLKPNGEGVVLVPWCWRGGQDLAQRVDEAIDADRQIRLGEGETQYRRDPDDPQSTADVRWLGSVVGAKYRGARVDLVIDTDGFFLLFSRQTDDTVATRLHFLRQSDRLTLLGSDPRNRWISQSEIRLVELTKNVRARLRGARRVLLVKLHDATSLDIELVDDHQVEIVTNEFGRMLGPFFQA